MNNNYHKYVIKDGKFIGDFETMYQNCTDPWNQLEEAEISYVRASTCISIKKYGLDSVMELGCGLGKTTNYIKKNTGIDIIGVDISETAVEKAKNMYPDIDFRVDNVLNISKSAENINYLFAEIMWYILDDLDEIIQNVSMKCRGNYVMINQTFYPKGCQSYGTEYFSTVDEMITYLPWKCVKKIVEYGENSFDTHTVFRVE